MTTLFLILSASAVYFAIVSGTLRAVDDDTAVADLVEGDQ